jgi:hypothetical protein
MKQNCSQPNRDVRIIAAFSLQHNMIQQKVLHNMTSRQMFMNRLQVLLHKLHVSFPVPVLGSGLKIATTYLTHFYCGTCFHSYGTTCNIDYVSKWLSNIQSWPSRIATYEAEIPYALDKLWSSEWNSFSKPYSQCNKLQQVSTAPEFPEEPNSTIFCILQT